MKIAYSKEEAEHIYFTSDTHFGHEAIIRFCNRPFANVEEMNQKMIDNWNKVIGPDDIVFHLGDFAFGGSKIWNTVLKQLNGRINLIIGNHDRKNLRQGYTLKFENINPQLHLIIDGRSVYLNHYPFLCYAGTYRNEKDAVWQLFGHVHSGPLSTGKDDERLKMLFPYQYDVGVDNNNFTPISWEDVKIRISNNIKFYNNERE